MHKISPHLDINGDSKNLSDSKKHLRIKFALLTYDNNREHCCLRITKGKELAPCLTNSSLVLLHRRLKDESALMQHVND